MGRVVPIWHQIEKAVVVAASIDLLIDILVCFVLLLERVRNESLVNALRTELLYKSETMGSKVQKLV